MHTVYYRTLLVEMKDNPSVLAGCVLKLFFLPKLILGKKSPQTSFVEIDERIKQFKWKCRGFRIEKPGLIYKTTHRES